MYTDNITKSVAYRYITSSSFQNINKGIYFISNFFYFFTNYTKKVIQFFTIFYVTIVFLLYHYLLHNFVFSHDYINLNLNIIRPLFSRKENRNAKSAIVICSLIFCRYVPTNSILTMRLKWNFRNFKFYKNVCKAFWNKISRSAI